STCHECAFEIEIRQCQSCVSVHVHSFLFFSSRRRHTISVSAFLLNRSSDLLSEVIYVWCNTASNSTKHKSPHLSGWRQIISLIRSEERRVGKEWRSRR